MLELWFVFVDDENCYGDELMIVVVAAAAEPVVMFVVDYVSQQKPQVSQKPVR